VSILESWRLNRDKKREGGEGGEGGGIARERKKEQPQERCR